VTTLRTPDKAAAPRRMSGRRQKPPVPPLRGAPDRSDYIEHRTADGRRVFVHYRVLDDLFRLERSQHPDETAGLLFGGFFGDRGTSCAIVTDLIPPEDQEVLGTPTTVTITAQGAERMIARAWQRNPLLQVLGWGHTHPRFEAYFSATDKEEQRVWRHPASVGIVVSGLPSAEDPYKVFVGPEATPATAVRRLPLRPSGGSSPRLADAALVGRADAAAPDRRPGAQLQNPALRALAAAATAIVVMLCISTFSWIAAGEARDEAHAARVEIRTLRKHVFAGTAAHISPEERARQATAHLLELSRGW
jgi:proteasome lid subunit RPN8/RPN11